jgi:outer membrane protein TolC
MANQRLRPVQEGIWRQTPLVLQKDWSEVAAENAAQLRRAEGELELAEATRKAERAAHWPELYLSARYTENDTFATNLRQETRVELQLRVPIYKGGATSSRVSQATERMYAAEYAVRDTLNNVQVEISRITEKLQGSYSRVQALRTAEESARAALDAAEQGFIGGVRSLNDLLDSRNRLSGIRRDVTREVFSNAILQFELRQMAGTLSASDMIAVSH